MHSDSRPERPRHTSPTATPWVSDATPWVSDATPWVSDATPWVSDATPWVSDATPWVSDATPWVPDANLLLEFLVVAFNRCGSTVRARRRTRCSYQDDLQKLRSSCQKKKEFVRSECRKPGPPPSVAPPRLRLKDLPLLPALRISNFGFRASNFGFRPQLRFVYSPVLLPP